MSRLFGDSQRLAQARPAEGLAGPARRESRGGSSSRGVRSPFGRGPSAPAEAALTGASNARRGGGPAPQDECEQSLTDQSAGFWWVGGTVVRPRLPVSGRSEEKTAAPADAEWPPLSQLSG